MKCKHCYRDLNRIGGRTIDPDKKLCSECYDVDRHHKTLSKMNEPTQMRTEKQCRDCADGEHGNYDDLVQLVKVIDPDTTKTVKRCYMCNTHQNQYLDDGYRIEEIG